MGGDSCSEGRGFKSQHQILDGHFSHLFVVKMCLFEKTKINEKVRGWPIFLKKTGIILWNVQHLFVGLSGSNYNGNGLKRIFNIEKTTIALQRSFPYFLKNYQDISTWTDPPLDFPVQARCWRVGSIGHGLFVGFVPPCNPDKNECGIISLNSGTFTFLC